MRLFQFLPLTLSLMITVLFSNSVYAADINAGKNKAMSCQGCHGTEGSSTNPLYPSLAGQRASYIEAQLKAFQSGLRTNLVMQGMSTGLTEQEIKNISAYFSNLSSESAEGNSTVTKQGQDKFIMCSGCHGAAAQGRGSFPKLAGQQAEYLKKQLLDFKSDSRKGGPMNAITSSLSEQDISEISAYLASL